MTPTRGRRYMPDERTEQIRLLLERINGEQLLNEVERHNFPLASMTARIVEERRYRLSEISKELDSESWSRA